jgi:hypothetical protein
MGYFMKEHDIYVGSMLDDLNLRFAPSQGDEHAGGIEEMVELQKEFELFKQGRHFATSVKSLHIGGGANHQAKNRFYRYLEHLQREKSNVPGVKGDAAIVAAIVKNLAAKKPLPVYFSNHDMRESEGVIIREKARPLFYMKRDYLWISLPSAPHEEKPRAKKARPRKK